MADCRWIRDVERWVDGEAPEPERIAEHVAMCVQCQAHVAGMRALRAAVAGVVRHRAIDDAQWPAFLAGIREGRAQRAGWRVSWRTFSVTMATLLVLLAGSLYTYQYLNMPAPPVVESVSTDIEDGAVTTYASPDGVTTIWVVSPDDDVW